MKVIQKYFLSVIFLALLMAGQAQDVVGSLNSSYFLQPPMPPRIYSQAPSGVVVTKIILPKYSHRNIPDSSIKSDSKTPIPNKANFQITSEIERGRVGAPCVPQYFLYQNQWTDYERFAIDRCSGTISTSKYVDKSIGHIYKIIVIATDHQNATIATKEIKIEVTSYNSKPPKLSLPLYTQEVLDTSSPGTLVITPVASDNDTDCENRELYFSLQRLTTPNNPWFWFHPVTTPLIMNVTSGEIRVSDALINCTSPLHFRVLVSDAGSPPRTDSARLTIHIRNMSAPRNVKILNITKSSMKVCWSPPLHGTPEGYYVAYNSRGAGGGNAKGGADGGKLNLTIDQLETRTDDPQLNIQMMAEGFPEENNTKKTNLEVQEEVYSFFAHQFCTLVDGLTPLTNYAISVRAWASNGRISMARVPLTAITWRKNCNDVVCEHGVCQEKTASPGFTCLCSTGFYGPYCQFEDPCIKNRNFTCRNGGTCVRSKGPNNENEPACDCPSTYFGTHCQYINPCTIAGSPCLNEGDCAPVDEEKISCRCPYYAKGERCEIRTQSKGPEFSCKEERTEGAEGAFFWPSTTVDDTAFRRCPFGVREVHVELSFLDESNNDVYTISNNSNPVKRSTGPYTRPEDELELHRYRRSTEGYEMASRKCIENDNGEIVWLDPRLSVCKTKEEEVQNIINVTSSIRSLNSTTLASTVRKISNLAKASINDKKMAQTMLSALSNILNVGEALLESTQDTSSSILATLDNYTSEVQLKSGEKVKLRSANLIVEAHRINKDDLPDEVSFSPYDPEEGNGEYSANEKPDTFWFKMPKDSLLQLSDLNSQNDVSSNSNNDLRLKFISFKDDVLFRRRGNKERLNKPVIRASVEDRTVRNLHTPFKFRIPFGSIDPFLDTPVCVFWDEEKHDWSTDGIVTKQNEKGEIICESHHLTSFSVLLDPIGTPIMAHIKPALSIITYIGITLSTVTLMATIVTFAIFSFNRDRSGLIVMNLSIALLLMNLCFLISHFIKSDQTGCWVFGALLHYAVTASFAWMLIEAVNMYQLLVTVFPSAETHFMRKRVIVGWVSPLVLVFIALAWNKNVYYNEHQSICVISPITAPAVYYTTYLVPVCIVLLINISVFLLVARVLCQSRPTYTRKMPVTLAQIRGAIAIVALLGITWLIGVFAVGPFRMASQILFCITTPFQGLIIFWVRVMQSADARMAWKTFLKTGSTRKRPQPLSSLRTHSSSHQASSFHTQSTGTTPPKSVYETALKTVRRLSSSGLGFIGSAKKFRSSSSSDGSTKRLNKKLSIDSEKNKKISNDHRPTGDNLICQLNQGLNNENNFCVFKNNDSKHLSQESYQNKINQEHRSPETNSSSNSEEPMKELHLILDIKFDKMRPEATTNDTERQTQEYIFSYLKSSRREANPKQISYSTSNLSPVKTKDGKEECARSLESLLPTIGKNYLKTRTDIYDNPANVSKHKSPSESSSNGTSSRRKLNQSDSVGNGSYNESVTKSASDSELNELTFSSEMGRKANPKINLGLEESDSESSTMPEITLSSDPTMAFTLSHRTSSELVLGPRASDSPCVRRSASSSDLEFMDQYVPYQNFSSKGYL